MASVDRSASPPGPQRVGPRARPWPLFDRVATRAAEQAALAHCAPRSLMKRAGTSVARLALALAPHARLIEVACGPGNNGGDGLVAAAELHRLGRRVRVLLFDAGAARPADAAWALQQALDTGVPISSEAPHAGVKADLFIDALLGLGSTRPLAGAMASWVARQSGQPTLAVDLPSGLDVDSGALLGGGEAVQATHTLTLLTLKPGLFTASGRDHAGQVWFDDLGWSADEGNAGALLFDADASVWRTLARRHASHKGSFGDLVVVGGAEGMGGAAQLAAQAALASGAGRVYLSALADYDAQAQSQWSGQRAELMQRRAWWQSNPAELRSATTVCGCGGGTAVAATLPALLANAGQLVLDADALNAIAADPALQAMLAARHGLGLVSVLTPHPLEAARLLGSTTAELMADRLGAARRLAERFAAIVVLKGSGSIVAARGERPTINASGNAALATPGSGDVLAGWIGGWLASGAASMAESTTNRSLATETVRLATWLHGHAADRFCAADPQCVRGPLRALDLIEAMHRAWCSAPTAAAA